MSVGPRERKVRILATLGPASDTREMIAKLMNCGADAFRINMSHGDQAAKAELVQIIRSLETERKRPTTILFDLQGPKLRVGKFKDGSAMLETGGRFILDDDATPGDETRAELPHPELFEAVREGDQLLIDDGKVRLRVAAVAATRIETIVAARSATTRASTSPTCWCQSRHLPRRTAPTSSSRSSRAPTTSLSPSFSGQRTSRKPAR
jgi:pyruvate kinase